MRVAELCAGYGGLSMGLELAGWEPEVVWYSEIDPHAAAVFQHHHPDAPNLGDLTTIDWANPVTTTGQVMPPVALEVDVLTAGYP